ncbi:30S ribosomal protein S20 [Marixanthomonas spongiae]|uniref:Small ribosomal subunit protein bS20 n=1 Tax=Marixanthomonas spongiae TaxID=2174845 RepID=A0A2U0I798_9FLAO|nr:30S ribosomal protein S20 [Marixanthomonas spongiae]PVW16983.1 30S ribosomal protein S20 [Marixanthomonas spongiae]
MANHKSALKRIRNSETKRLRNRYQFRTTRNAIKKLKGSTDKKEAEKLFPEVTSMIDKLAKNNVIHDNKADRLKSQIARHVATL